MSAQTAIEADSAAVAGKADSATVAKALTAQTKITVDTISGSGDTLWLTAGEAVVALQPVVVKSDTSYSGDMLIAGNVTADTLKGYGGQLTGVAAISNVVEKLPAGSWYNNPSGALIAPLTIVTGTYSFYTANVYDSSTVCSLFATIKTPDSIVNTDEVQIDIHGLAVTAGATDTVVWVLLSRNTQNGEAIDAAFSVDTLGFFGCSAIQGRENRHSVKLSYATLGWTQRSLVDIVLVKYGSHARDTAKRYRKRYTEFRMPER